MKQVLAVSAAAAILTLGGGAATWAATDRTPPPDTVVDVNGDRYHGWSIEHYDGSVDYAPTVEKAKAVCDRFHHKVHWTRCRARLFVRYHGFDQMQAALNYAGR